MKKALGLVIVLMLLSWSVAVVHPVRATPTTAENSAYDAFWDILNREAELYARVVNGNSSAVPALVDNSRLGAENAVNISTLIWESIEELKASGVKTYYTADELRAMAENISKNGLPNETVQELKAQGWTDDQIKALEEYIAKNANNITGDFNMTAFLQNFSTAFMRVAFKYNHYWAYGLERLLNRNSSSLDIPMVVIAQGSSSVEVPGAWDTFANFKAKYNGETLYGKLALVKELEESVLNMSRDTGWRTISSTRRILKDKTSCPITSNPALLEKAFKNASLVSRRLVNGSFVIPISSLPSGAVGYYSESVSVRSFVSGQYIIVEVRRSWSSQKVLNDCSVQTASGEDYTIYYWRAFETLEALKNLEVTLEAMQKGNGNPDLKELEANITNSLPELFKTEKVGYYSHSSRTIVHRPIPGDPQPRAIEGTSPTSGDASLNVGVEVSAADVTKDYATYKVTVSLQAEGGSVSDVDVTVDGDGLNDSKHYNVISGDDGVVRWTTKASSKIYGSDSVTVSGTVKVTYTVSHATPTSVSVPIKDSETTSDNSRTITKDYSETINLGTRIDPDKVTFRVVPSKSEVPPDSDVTFTVEITNKNKIYINSDYTLDVAYPFENNVETITFSNSSTVNGGSSKVVTAGTVHYASTGTFHYSGVLKFDGFSKTAEGDIVVSSNGGSNDPPKNALRIVNVTPEPKYPKEGDTVSFNVVVENDYPSGQNFSLVLSLDKDWGSSLNATIGPNSVKTFVLPWRALSADIFSWFIGLWQGNELKSWKNGTISVGPSAIEVTGCLKPNVSTTVTVGTKAHFNVCVKSLVDKFTYDFPVIVEYNYVNPAGRVHEPITVIHSYVSQLAPKEKKNVTWFDFRFDNPGKYMFTLYVNGTPVDDKTITVKPEGNVVAWMECNSTAYWTSSTTCIVYIKNLGSASVRASLREIEFGGMPIWNGTNDLSTKIPMGLNRTVIVKPNSETDKLGFEIVFNDNLLKKVLSVKYFSSTHYRYVLVSEDKPEIYRISATLSIENGTSSTVSNVSYDIMLLMNSTTDIDLYDLGSMITGGASVVVTIVGFDTVGITLLTADLLLYIMMASSAPRSPSIDSNNNLIGGG